MRGSSRTRARGAGLLLALLAVLQPAAARAGGAPPPECWESLGFSAGSRWASASSTLRFERHPGADAALPPPAEPGRPWLEPGPAGAALLETRFSAMRSHGELLTWYDAATGAALYSRRTGHGSESRQKVHRFLADGVWRERRTPAAGAPDGWQGQGARVLPYPAATGGAAVLTPVLLVPAASRLALEPASSKQTRLVFTDTQLYRVVLHAREPVVIAATYTLQEGAEPPRTVSGERRVRRVDLRAHLLGDEPEDEPFTLLELEGEIALFVDIATGLPVRIQGSWLRVGVVPVELASARLAAKCVP